MKSLKRDFISKLLSNWEQNQESQVFYNNRLNYLNENFQRLNPNTTNALEIQNLFLNYYNFTCELLAFKINSFFYEKRENNLNLNQKFLDLLRDGDVFYLEKCVYILSFVLKNQWRDKNGQQSKQIESFINKYDGIWSKIRNYLSSSHSFNPFFSQINIDGIFCDIINEIREMNQLVSNLSSGLINLYDEINLSDKTLLNNFDYFGKKCLQIFRFITETKKWIDGKKSEYDNNAMNLASPKKGGNYLNSLYIYIILNIDEFYYNANVIQYWVAKINQQEIYDFLLVFLDNTLYYNALNNQNDLFFFKLSSDNNVRLFDFISQVLRNGNNNNNKYTFFDKLKNYFFNANNNNNNSFFNSSLSSERKNSYDFSIAAAFFKSELIDYFLSNYFNNNVTDQLIIDELFNFYKNIFLRNGNPYSGIPYNLWKLEEKITKYMQYNNYSNFLEYIYYRLSTEPNLKYFLEKRFNKKNENDNYYYVNFLNYFLWKEVIITPKNNVNDNLSINAISEILWLISTFNDSNIRIVEHDFYHLKIRYLWYYDKNIDSLIFNKYSNIVDKSSDNWVWLREN